MDFSRQIEDNRRALIADVLRRLEEQLWPFHYALDAFLAQLFKAVIPQDWREKFHTFIAEQEANGFTIAESSVSELEAWIEAWAKDCKLWPEETAVALKEVEARIPNLVQKPPPRTGRPPRHPPHPGETAIQAHLQSAEKCYLELERILEALGQRLDAAATSDVVVFESEVIAVEDLIWRFNNAREAALEEWYRQDFSRERFERIVNSTRIPSHLGLPSYIDDQQGERYLELISRIGKKLSGRNRTMDRVELGARVTEWFGFGAGVILTGGMLYGISQSSGKWAVVKTLAIIGGVAAGAALAEKGLRAAGAPEEVIRGARLAAMVISIALTKRRTGSGSSSPPPSANSKPQSAPNRGTPTRPGASGGSSKPAGQSPGSPSGAPPQGATTEPSAGTLTPATKRPGSISGNRENRLVETGEPLKDGSGWRRRWTRMTRQEELDQSQAVSDHYKVVQEDAKRLSLEEQKQYIFEEMRKFRTEYRRAFLENRDKK